MKVLVFSDLHDNLVNLKKLLSLSFDAIFCCGDITNADTLDYLATHFSGPIYLVFGNMELYDRELVGEYPNIILSGRYLNFVFDHKNIGLCHEPMFIDKCVGADYIFYGHTHKAWMENRGKTIVSNPGTAGGVFSLPTYAIFDTISGTIKLEQLF